MKIFLSPVREEFSMHTHIYDALFFFLKAEKRMQHKYFPLQEVTHSMVTHPRLYPSILDIDLLIVSLTAGSALYSVNQNDRLKCARFDQRKLQSVKDGGIRRAANFVCNFSILNLPSWESCLLIFFYLFITGIN
jgi:hypothetical protein